MTQEPSEVVSVESEGGSPVAFPRFKSIPRLRTRQDEDLTPIAYSNRAKWAKDNIYPHSGELLGIYIERSTELSFRNTVKYLRGLLTIKGEQLGDFDGVLLFPWDEVNKLHWFFKAAVSDNGKRFRKGKK